MKKLSLIILLFIFFGSCEESKISISNEIKLEVSKPEIDKDKELQLIMDVIASETACLYKRDYNCWKAYWVQDKSASHSYNKGDGTYNTLIGWDKINEEIRTLMVNEPVKDKKSLYPIVKRKNVQVKFLGDKVAYLFWEQYQSDGKLPLYKKSQEIRVVEKIKGTWKLVNLSTFWDYKNKVLFEN